MNRRQRLERLHIPRYTITPDGLLDNWDWLILWRQWSNWVVSSKGRRDMERYRDRNPFFVEPYVDDEGVMQ